METHHQKTTTYWFALLAFVQLVVWTALPAALVHGTYIDILENLEWARHLQFGYDKNPPFGAWLTRPVYELFGGSLVSIYVLSQVAVVTCFWAVWRMAKRMLPPAHALISVILLTTIFFYSVTSPEFNDDMIELPLWALSSLAFYAALRTQSYRDWLILAAVAALAFLTKYYFVALGISMLAFVVLQADARKSLSRREFHVAVLVFLLLIAPNILWQSQNGWVSAVYALKRAGISSVPSAWSDHLVNPALFVLSLAAVLVPTAVVGWTSFASCRAAAFETSAFDRRFVATLLFGPIVVTALFAAVTGGRIRITWAAPLFNLVGLFAMLLWRPELDSRRLRRFGASAVCMVLFWVGVYITVEAVYPYLRESPIRETFPGRALASRITEDWRGRYCVPLRYIAGSREIAANVAAFSPDHPVAYFDWDRHQSEWIDEVDLARNGAAYIWSLDRNKNRELPPELVVRFPALQVQGSYTLDQGVSGWGHEWLGFQPLPPLHFAVAFLPPRAADEPGTPAGGGLRGICRPSSLDGTP